jgi:hypothetical protein
MEIALRGPKTSEGEEESDVVPRFARFYPHHLKIRTFNGHWSMENFRHLRGSLRSLAICGGDTGAFPTPLEFDGFNKLERLNLGRPMYGRLIPNGLFELPSLTELSAYPLILDSYEKLPDTLKTLRFSVSSAMCAQSLDLRRLPDLTELDISEGPCPTAEYDELFRGAPTLRTLKCTGATFGDLGLRYSSTDQRIDKDGCAATDQRIDKNGRAAADQRIDKDGCTATDQRIDKDGCTATDQRIDKDGCAAADQRIGKNGRAATDQRIDKDGRALDMLQSLTSLVIVDPRPWMLKYLWTLTNLSSLKLVTVSSELARTTDVFFFLEPVTDLHNLRILDLGEFRAHSIHLSIATEVSNCIKKELPACTFTPPRFDI